MRPIPETQQQIRQQLTRVWDAPDQEGLRNAVQALANALEAHLEEEAESSSLLAATALPATWSRASSVQSTITVTEAAAAWRALTPRNRSSSC